MDSPDPPSPGIPTSVLDFKRSANGGAGGGLHFRYDLSALAAAAATTEMDEAAMAKQQLREEAVRLARKLERAQVDRQRLVGELGVAQRENQRLTKALNGALAQNSQATLVVQRDRNERARAEHQLKMAQNANNSLLQELSAAHEALAKERARTATAVASTALLRKERDVLRQYMPRPSRSTSTRTAREALDVPMDPVEDPDLVPLSSTPSVHRPSVTSSVSRPTSTSTRPARDLGGSFSQFPVSTSSSPTPIPTLKRKRSPAIEEPTTPKAPPVPVGIGTGKLGISHLPLLYDTQGASMYCRSCRQRFPQTAPWADLAGHWRDSDEAHAEACREIEALRPAQVLERSRKLRYLGNGKR
ncbi:hypothetical protein C8R46DRAFT_1192497 [Mycena filopes]|nr:hypothetical protein C8R46DRAFT_1192497 [Mycena filopes]